MTLEDALLIESYLEVYMKSESRNIGPVTMKIKEVVPTLKENPKLDKDKTTKEEEAGSIYDFLM